MLNPAADQLPMMERGNIKGVCGNCICGHKRAGESAGCGSWAENNVACSPCRSQRRVEGRLGLEWAVEKLNNWAAALLSLNRSCTESSLSPHKRASTKGMSIRDAWTSPKKLVDLSQAWRQSATNKAIDFPSKPIVSRMQCIMNLPLAIAWDRMALASSETIFSTSTIESQLSGNTHRRGMRC